MSGRIKHPEGDREAVSREAHNLQTRVQFLLPLQFCDIVLYDKPV